MFKRTLTTTAKSIVYSTHGIPKEVISIHSYSIPPAQGNQVVLKTKAFPINPSDVNQLEGVYPSKPEKTLDYGTAEPSAIAGNEAVFEVVETGSGVSGFAPGDLVIPKMANFGTWSTHRAADADELIKLPRDIGLLEAATISVNAVTAWDLIRDCAEGDWVIQNAGTSGVSKLVSQIAKKKGVKVVSVIRDRDNFDEVAESLKKLGATVVVSESQAGDRSFPFKEATENAKIKLGLNSVGGKSVSNLCRKLANDATIVTYGGMSKQPFMVPTGPFIFKNLTCKGYWVTQECKKNPQYKVDAVNALAQMYLDGELDVDSGSFGIRNWKSGASDEELKQVIVEALETKGKKQIIIVD